MNNIKTKQDADEVIDKYVKDGFHFSAQSANGMEDWHCYPRPESTKDARFAIHKLLDDIEAKGHKLFDVKISGEDDGSFTIECYDWDTRDHFTVFFDEEDEYGKTWFLKLYHVPKEIKTLGFEMDDGSIDDDKLINLYDWLVKRHEMGEQ